MATRKFQKGDLVRCVNSSGVEPILRRGALYALEEPRYERYVRTNDLNWLPERFELVRPVGGFQIGDRVEIGGWPLLVAKADLHALAEHNLQTVKFIERPEHHGFKVGYRVNLKTSPKEEKPGYVTAVSGDLAVVEWPSFTLGVGPVFGGPVPGERVNVVGNIIPLSGVSERFAWAQDVRGNDLLRDKAYKAWLDEERDGRLRSAFEAGWEARGGK